MIAVSPNEYPFVPRKLAIGKEEMSYVDEGTGRPVVLLHGNPTWSFFYRDLIKALSPHRRCIAPDHIGCGYSSKPQDYAYTLAQHIENVLALIDHLHVEEFDLVVHDWGGAIGMGVRAALREKVGRIQIFNTAAFREKIPYAPLHICRAPLLGPLAVRGANGFVRWALQRASTKGLSKNAHDGFLFPYQNWHDRVAIHNFVKDIPIAKNHRSYDTLVKIEASLSDLQKHPIQICWGMQDFVFTPHFITRWKEYAPHALIHEFPDAGHYLLEDKQAEIIPLVQAFLLQN